MTTFADFVLETTTTTGTGAYALGGAYPGRRTFVAGAGDGTSQVPYVVSDGTDFEAGYGTVTAGTPDSLSRDTITDSSNGGSAVNWGSGEKAVALANHSDWLNSVYHRDNILGTVSQSSGVPTGAIFEEDENADGSFRVTADGIVEMWGYKDVTLDTSQAFFQMEVTWPTSIDKSLSEPVVHATSSLNSSHWDVLTDRLSFWDIRLTGDSGGQLFGYNGDATNWGGTSGRVYWSVKARKF